MPYDAKCGDPLHLKRNNSAISVLSAMSYRSFFLFKYTNNVVNINENNLFLFKICPIKGLAI